MAEKEHDEQTKIIVIDEGKSGIIVDNVSEIVTIEEKDTDKIENIFMGNVNKSISSIAKIGDKLISIINIEELSKDVHFFKNKLVFNLIYNEYIIKNKSKEGELMNFATYLKEQRKNLYCFRI